MEHSANNMYEQPTLKEMKWREELMALSTMFPKVNIAPSATGYTREPEPTESSDSHQQIIDIPSNEPPREPSSSSKPNISSTSYKDSKV